MIYDLLRSPLHHSRPSLITITYESSLSLSQQPAAAGRPSAHSSILPTIIRTATAIKIRAAREIDPQPLPTFFGSKKIRETNGRTHGALYIGF
jgi:hypothetical protein